MRKLCLLAAVLMTAALNVAQAQEYPTRTVTIIVPFAAGGPADITGRIVAEIFSRHLGQQFVVENVGGAGGTLGSLRAARPRPTATRIISGHMGTHAAAPLFYPNLGYDPEKDFEPIGLIAEQPELLAVRKDIPGKQPQGVHRLGEGEREQAEHGSRRRRLGVLCRLPAAQCRDRHQADDGALHRHGAGDECDPRRADRL